MHLYVTSPIYPRAKMNNKTCWVQGPFRLFLATDRHELSDLQKKRRLL